MYTVEGLRANRLRRSSRCPSESTKTEVGRARTADLSMRSSGGRARA
jgi:hypothetical protein